MTLITTKEKCTFAQLLSNTINHQLKKGLEIPFPTPNYMQGLPGSWLGTFEQECVAGQVSGPVAVV